MKQLMLALALLAPSLLSCGSNSTTTSAATTEMSGDWSITIKFTTVANSVPSQSVFQLSPTSNCQTGSETPLALAGPYCFLTTGYAPGSWTWYAPGLAPDGVLIGVPEDPVPANQPTTVSFSLLMTSPDGIAGEALVNGSGTVSNGVMSGTWTWNLNITNPQDWCSGGNASGTFSGTKQGSL
jgi:hypothetical protein